MNLLKLAINGLFFFGGFEKAINTPRKDQKREFDEVTWLAIDASPEKK